MLRWCGSVHFHLCRVWAFRLREAHNPVFFRYVILMPAVPFRKGIFVVVDIALRGKNPPVILYRVPSVFLIHEIVFCGFGQLQFVQFVDKVMPVSFFVLYGGINPVAIKVLCKVDKVFHASGIFAQCYRCRKFVPVLVTLHF